MTLSESIDNYRSIELLNKKDTKCRELSGKSSSYKKQPELINNNKKPIIDETKIIKQFEINYDYPNEENIFQHNNSPINDTKIGPKKIIN